MPLYAIVVFGWPNSIRCLFEMKYEVGNKKQTYAEGLRVLFQIVLHQQVGML